MAPRLLLTGLLLVLFWLSPLSSIAQSASTTLTNGNRLAYLDESDPFYPGLQFPKLTTPQWIGEPGVDAVVILAIDDMRETAKYEAFIRPMLERLKKIDGRAPFSIMCNKFPITNSIVETWLKEGVSLEVHTLTHPFPLLAKSNFVAAVNDYNGCIDMLNQIPGNKPVAYRMPYCDSLNTPSPRFYAEIFNSTNSLGQFLSIDSSIMNITTSADPALLKDMVIQPDGKERFRKYIPFPSFVTTIENYPYPYVIGKLCWEFPAMVPSDWEAKNIHNTNNPITLADWKIALDATVLKQGAFTYIFHPHGWMRPDQYVDFIDYAASKYGKRVKFLSFKEANDRLNANLLAGQPLRSATGEDNGVRLLDLNNDGYLDVLIGNDKLRQTRIWDPKERRWLDLDFPNNLVKLEGGRIVDQGVRFGIIDGQVALLSTEPDPFSSRKDLARLNVLFSTGALFTKGRWASSEVSLGAPTFTVVDGRDHGVRLRDIDGDGQCELIVGNEKESAVFRWNGAQKRWIKAEFGLPAETAIVDELGRDAGLRFLDVDGDGYLDVLFSDLRRYSLHLYRPKADPRLNWAQGWTDEVIAQSRRQGDLIPMIARGGEHPHNGAWFHSGTMWVQNEDTTAFADHVDRRSFKQLLTCNQSQSLSPEESLAKIKVASGFKVELVATEPLVLDPIAFDWSADGRMWVVEMGDYPSGTDGKGKPGGRVLVLEDTTGDGRYDKSTVFLTGVNFPNGLIPWRKGVIISAAPEIFYAEDTNGDGKADIHRTLFTGFVEGNQQHRANGFEYGLDNWLYGANGDSGGVVSGIDALMGKPLAFRTVVNLRGHDFRIRPDEGVVETVAGQTQFGRHRNDWGDWFGNNNPTWLWHYYLPEQYLTRNPNLAVRNTKRMLANYPDSTRAYPASVTMQRFNDPGQANHVTSGNTATPYRDELFGPEFANSVFISEPVHNLIHREVLEREGVSFTSHRAKGESESEFLASADNWFRPTMLKTGPDGALYIADMYRLVIEHPEWIPPQIQKRLDLRAGDNQGRIYRVYPEGAKLRPIPKMDQLSAAELVAALDSPNGWQRDTAQRLLVHAQAKDAVPQLKKLLSANRPLARLHALATLDGLNALGVSELLATLKDEHAMVRRFALQLSEQFLRSGNNDKDVLLSAVSARVDDPEMAVRYQAAFTLGESRSPMAAHALVKLAERDGENADMTMAILTSAEPHAAAMLAELLDSKKSSEPAPILGGLLTSTSVAKDRDAVAKALGAITQSRSGEFAAWQYRALLGLIAGLERQGKSLQEFVKSAGSKNAGVDEITRSAREVARHSSKESDRVAAIALLGRASAPTKEDSALLGELLTPQNTKAIQAAAFDAVRKLAHPAAVLVPSWRVLSPGWRLQTLELLGSRNDSVNELFAAIESGKIGAGEISMSTQQKLLLNPDLTIRAHAEKVFSAPRADRQSLVRQYVKSVPAAGDAEKGRNLFKQNCAVCHRLHGEGIEIGPDLAMVSGKPDEVLLAAVLDPNQAVEARYVSYNVATKNGRELSGVISAETATSLTLRSQGGTEEVLLRSDIAELRSSGVSLMPEGLENVLKPADMADLLAFVRSK